MGSTEERHASFHKWPMHIKLLPISMAAAGFYHSNKRTNTVTCFSCTSILKNNQGPAAYDGGGIIIEGCDPGQAILLSFINLSSGSVTKAFVLPVT